MGKTEVLSVLFSSSDKNNSCLAGVAEVINADSVQVYKHMKIGAASPPKTVTENLPHHLVEIINPDKEFSTADFVKEADRLCPEIFNRRKLPVISGGSAFFLKNFIYGLPITPAVKEKTRSFFQSEIKNKGAAALLEDLRKIDPLTAKKLHVNDEYRITRALEVYADSGKPLSFFAESNKPRCLYEFLIISLERPRNILYEMIDTRVENMFAGGLFEEFKNLYKNGYRQTSPGLKAIGYKEFFEVNPDNPLEAEEEKVKFLVKRNTKRYAKRQETFFKKFPNVINIDLNNQNYKEILSKTIFNFYERFF